MNKNSYRLVFNAARGCIMVVSEAAQRSGKGGGVASTAASTAATTAVSRAKAVLLCLALTVLSAAMVQAQIIADPSAPNNQRPTVLGTSNETLLVNIQTPSAAGVSRNTYQQFDVGAPGAVLNNSRTNVQTQLRGWVQANPWLATGEARIILNEVNSANPSHLNGYIEVAGRRAEVVIANPSGINVNGAGFINVSRATLTTGTPVMSAGNLEAFRVQRGTISVNGTGLNATLTDYAAILARAIEVNAHIHAQQLHLVSGVNSLDAQTNATHTEHDAPQAQGPSPLFALDVTELGGMYAGHIRLIGTEAGVGVRHHGTLAASVGDIHISTNGWLHSAGHIQANQGNIHLSASDLIHSGHIQAQQLHAQTQHIDLQDGSTVWAQAAHLQTQDFRLSQGAQLYAHNALELQAQTLSHAGLMQSGAHAQLHVEHTLDNSGTLIAATDLTLQAQDINNHASGEISSQGTTTLNTTPSTPPSTPVARSPTVA